MHNYRGEIRRQADHTPTKSSWQNQKNNFQQIQQQKYTKNKDYQKSQLSYYQSQASHTIYQNNNENIIGTRQFSMLQKNRSTSTINNNNNNNSNNLTNNNNQNKQLYDNLIPIKIQSSDREQYSTYLRVQIISTIQKGMNKLTLYLTDDRDPKFLWLFFIKQNDFMILKKQQKLRVDFRAFPTMLMDHFDMCKSQKDAINSINMGECYFFSLFQLKKNQGSLNILQANKYKQSVHLSLKCKLGNDEQIKQYLSQKLLKSQNQNMSLRNTISNLQHVLNLRKQQITKIQIQLKQQRKQNEKSSEQYQIQYSKLQTQLKKQKIQNQQRIKKLLQKQYKQMKISLEQQLNKYIKSYDQLKSKYQNIQQKFTTIQSKQRQLNFQVITKAKQVQTYIKRLQEIKQYTSELQTNRTNDQKVIIQQKVRIQSMQSQINDKLKIIQSNSELKSTNSHQISSLELKNQQYKKQIQKLQTKIQTLQNELSKQQTSLQQYRRKYQKNKQKNQQKNNIIKQQQKYVVQKQNQVFDLKRQLQNKQKQMDENKLDLEQNNRKINDLKRQIQQCQKKIKQDNDLITHLQKQLNERTIGIRPSYTGGISSYQRSTSPFSSTVSATNRDYTNINTNTIRDYTNNNNNYTANNRDYTNTNSSLGNTSTSRFKLTSQNYNNLNNQQIQCKNQRKDVQIKRYIPNQDRQRSKSPISNSRLNQQKDPEDMKNTNIVKPIKFKFSQKQ